MCTNNYIILYIHAWIHCEFETLCSEVNALNLFFLTVCVDSVVTVSNGTVLNVSRHESEKHLLSKVTFVKHVH